VFSIAVFIFHVVVDAACLIIVTWPIGFLRERVEILDHDRGRPGNQFQAIDLRFETDT
jgi:hypothetical protein